MMKRLAALTGWREALIALTLVASSATTPALAQTRQLISENCRQGSCWEIYLLGKRVIHQDRLAGVPSTLYAVELETEEGTSRDRSTDWVQCSTEEPFTASVAENYVIVNYLNPGEGASGYNTDAHQLYWAVCHGVFNRDVVTPELAIRQRARQLGYSLTIQEEQRQIPQVMFQR